MKPVRGRETLLLENGDAEGNVGIKSPPFRLWGKEKALTGFPPTLVWFYLINWMYCPWIVSLMQGCIMRSRPSLAVYIT